MIPFTRRLRAAAYALAIVATGAWGQSSFPSKAITIVVPFPTGGGVDRLARVLGEKLRDKWGQPVVVENRPGAAANIGAAQVWKSAPDGHTILFTAPGPLVVNKALFPKLDFDPDTFVPISVLISGANMLAVHPRTGLESVQQLVAYAKANPGKLNYGTQGSGSMAHLATELMQSMAGIRMTHVPYKGTGPAVTDLLGGQIEVMFLEYANAGPHVRAGKLKLLAVGSERRNGLLPAVPAMTEILPGFVSSNWTGAVAPPGTPTAIAQQLHAALAEGLRQPDVTRQLAEQNNDLVASTPEEMAVFMRQETRRWGDVIRGAGLKPE